MAWQPAAGATDYVVYYDDTDKPVDLATATQKDAGEAADNGVDITGLRNATKYRFVVVAKNSAGQSLPSTEVSATPAAANALSVAVTPADAAAGVSRAPHIVLVFNRAVVPSTVTTAVGTTSCTGVSLQVSADNFATCVQMTAQPTATANNTTYTVVPASALAGATTYKIRVTKDVKEPIGGAFDTQFNGTFTTSDALAFASTTPSDNATAVSLRPTISITFNRAPQAGTLTTNTGDTSCSGTLQLSSNNFLSCVLMVAAPAASSDGLTYTVTPALALTGSTAYQLRVTTGALDSDGVGPVAPLVATFQTNVPFAVSALAPLDGTTAAPLNSAIAVTFTRAADQASITTNTADASCSGTLQVSNDDFVTCVQMAAPPATTDNVTFTVTPAALLVPQKLYKVRVRNDAHDPDGVALASNFNSANGFRTDAALAVLSTVPGDAATAVAINTGIVVTFNKPVTAASITSAGANCAGAIQLSSDPAFGSCVAFTAAPVANGTNTAFSVQPAAPLNPATTYYIRVATSAVDAAGVALAGTFTLPHGFQTDVALAPVTKSPAPSATNVALNTPIQFTFNRPLDPATVTVSTAGNACAGSLQVSSDGFATCVPMAAQPVATNNNRTFTVTSAAPLAAQTTYVVRLTTAIAEPNGAPLVANLDATSFTTNIAIAVTSTAPSGTQVALNPGIVVTFNRAAQAASITANTADTACTGAVQLSRDGFATCVKMGAQPVASGNNTTFTVTPAQPLAESTAYTVRVSTSALDADGVALGAVYTAPQAFTTGAALAIASTSPASGATSVPINTAVAVTFNKAALASSMTANVTGTSCTGSLQLSTDNFATCVQMTANPSASADQKTFTMQPAALLSSSTAYQIRVTTAAQDATGVALAAAYTLPAAFTTNAPLAVAAMTPVDGATAVPVNSTISIQFNRAVSASTVTTNTNGTACSGVLQISSDDFASCARMQAQPASGDGKTYSVVAAGALAASTLYKVRVTTGVRDTDGVPLPAQVTSAGFTTDNSLGITATNPVDGQTGVALNSSVAIQFNKAVDGTTVTTNTADTSCSGSLQLSRSGDNFSSCVRMAAQPAASGGGTIFTLVPAAPLDGSTTYKLRITSAVKDTAGVPLPSLYESPAGFFTDQALAIMATSPVDSATTVALNTRISVTFNKTAQNITANTTDTACSGSVQLSSDGFVTCAKMTAQPTTADNKTFTMQPATTLDGVTAYRIRVTTGAQDAAGVPLASVFTTPNGFLTDAPLEIASTTPANAATAVALNSAIAVTFNKPADPATITTAVGATACTGSVQVSSDGFAHCVQMTAQPATADNKTFTLTPVATLAPTTVYKVRVTTAAQDPAGVALANTFTTPSGFTTDQALAIASTSPADGATSVAQNSAIVVTFNKATTPSTIDTTTAGTTCAGAIQVSSDNFVSCVRMATPPVSSANDSVFTLTPASVLNGAATYKIRVLTAAKDAAGVSLSPAYVQGTGFVTQNALLATVGSPADGSTAVALNTAVRVDFNKAALPSSITTNTDTSCSGTLQLSGNNFASCVAMAAQPAANGANTSFTLTPAAPLSQTTLYKVRVTVGAKDAAGVALASAFTSAGFTTDLALGVSATTPADLATTVALNTSIKVDFNKALKAGTATTNTADGACTGSLQVSSDNFSTCVRMASAPVANGSSTSFTLQPAAPLAASTVYKIRVTSGAQDAAGVPLSPVFTTASGFTTDIGLGVASTTPADNTSGAALNTSILVTFNKIAAQPSITTNTADTTCSGSIQVSGDNFATCVRMSAAPFTTNSGTTWSVTPAAPLAGSATYLIRVTTAATDLAGVAMAAAATTPHGFTTNAALAIASTTPADGATLVALNAPISVTFNRSAQNVTVNTTDTTCTGALQVSKDNFATCVKFGAAAVGTNGNATFTATPASPLAGDTQYFVRVGPPAKDGDGVTIGGTTTSVQGFHTNAAIAVASVTPANGTTAVPQNTSITVAFNRAASAPSVTANSSTTACTGSLQLSSDGFNTCIRMQSSPVAGSGNLSWTIKPAALLSPTTTWVLKVAGVQDADGVMLAATYLSGGFTTAQAFAVSATSPADTATLVALNTPVAVTFNTQTDASTVTVNTTDTTCSGTVRVSSDNFASCVKMLAQPSVDASGTVFTVQPAAPLSGNTTYKVRVVTGVSEIHGVPLAAQYDQATGFKTNFALAVSSTAPTGTSVALNAPISVTFGRAALPSSITTNTADASCSGALQLSSDNFTTCVQMSAAPVASAGNTVFTVQPQATLTGSTNFQIRVTTAARDSDGVALASTFTSAAFKTAVPIAVSSFTPADNTTAAPLNQPVTVTFNRAPLASSITTNTSDTTCSGALQISRASDNFTTCAKMAAAPSTSDGLTWSIAPAQPLQASTKYLIRVSTAAQDADGVALSSTFTTTNGFTTNFAIAVASTAPASGATQVALNTSIAVTFNRAAKASTVTVNGTSATCTGSLQVATDAAFTSCVRLASVSPNGGNTTFTASLFAPLAGSTQYWVRVTTAAQDADGVSLGAQFTLAAPFATKPALQVATASPSGTAVALNAPVVVTFNRGATPGSLTVTSTTACTGSLQLSKDDFATCVPLATPTTSDNLTFTATHAAALAAVTQYKVKVTTAAQDGDGAPMPADFISPAFTTDIALAVTSVTPADGATNLARNVPVVLQFNKAVDTTSVTANASCTGSVQVKTGSTCVAYTVAFNTAHDTATLTPSTDLAGSTTYAITVTTGVKDAAGVNLGANVAQATGFTTKPAISVSLTTPADAATLVALNTGLKVTFSAAASSVSSLTSGTSCTGSLQLSSSAAFSTCVAMSAQPATADGGLTYTVQPAATLAGSTTYFVKVTTGVTDSDGAHLPATATFSFTTNAAIAATASPASGATAVPLNTPVILSFNRAATASTIVAGDATCTAGSVHLSTDNTFGVNHCVALSLTAVNGNAYTFQPAATLSGSTTYYLRVDATVKDSDGVAMASALNQSFVTNAAIAVAATTPADPSTGISRATAVSVQFNRAPDATTLSTNTDNSCSGSIQVSSDPLFGTCVAMTGAVANAGSNTFSVTPAMPLAGNVTYKVRVLNSVKDADGVLMSGTYTSITGFTTKDAIAVALTSPADNATQVARTLSSIFVDFNVAAKASSLTTNVGADTTCSGTLQVSKDSFATCVPMTAQPAAGNGGLEYTVQPVSLLAGSTTYFVRVTTGAQDADGVALASTYTQPHGFTTKPELLVSVQTPTGNAVSVNSIPSITFSRTANGISSGANCTGSIRMYDASNTCVSGTVAPAGGNSYTYTPASMPLAFGTSYYLEVETSISDSDGTALAQTYQSPLFTTEPQLTVLGTVPQDGVVALQPLNTPVVIDFNKAVDLSSLTFTSTHACTDVVQLSADGFTTCVNLTAATSLPGNAAQLTLAEPLAENSTYLIRVKAAAKDTSGFTMAADYTSLSGFTTKAAMQVVSIAPSGTGIARNAPVTVTFSRAADPGSVTGNTSGTAACTGSVQVSSDGFATCYQIADVTTSDNLTFQITPLGGVFPGGATMVARVTTDATDADGVNLAAGMTGSSFTVSPAMSVSSVTPANNANPVALGSTVAVTFNEQPQLASLTTGCSGNVMLSADPAFGSCVTLTGPAESTGATYTFTPSPQLAASTTYYLRVKKTALDGQGAPMDADFNSQFTTGTLPAAPTSLNAAMTLQGAALSWTNNAAGLKYNVYVGGVLTTTTAIDATGATLPLAPFASYSFKVTAVDAIGSENPAGATGSGATAFTGAAADFVGTQQVTGVSNNHFRLSWTGSDLFAAVSKANDTQLLVDDVTNPSDNGTPNALWIAVDTDPAGDANGEWKTTTQGSNDIIWPFKADYVIELKATSPTTTQVNLRTVSANSWSSIANTGFRGALDEVKVSKALLGTPAQARFAMALVYTDSGKTIGFAPNGAGLGTDVTGYFGSITTSYDAGSNVFTDAARLRSLDTTSGGAVTRVAASALVTMSFTKSGTVTGPVGFFGSEHPLSYNSSLVSYSMNSLGGGTFQGKFNFGGSTKELYFKAFDSGDAVTPSEFVSGSDRLWTLGGTQETVPALTYDVAYGATHSFTINFACTTGGSPKEISGNVTELGAGAAPVTGLNPSTASVVMSSHDFTSHGTSLSFQMRYQDNSLEGGAAHTMNDDVINRRTLTWSAGDSSSF